MNYKIEKYDKSNALLCFSILFYIFASYYQRKNIALCHEKD